MLTWMHLWPGSREGSFRCSVAEPLAIREADRGALLHPQIQHTLPTHAARGCRDAFRANVPQDHHQERGWTRKGAQSPREPTWLTHSWRDGGSNLSWGQEGFGLGLSASNLVLSCRARNSLPAQEVPDR